MRALLVLALVVLGLGRADAYPQFQLSHDQTCTGCHVSPAGGGLLNENGLATSETMSMFGTAPEFMYGTLDKALPSWLMLGGDIRTAYGAMSTPERVLVAFPMQAEVYARAAFGPISVHATGGLRPAQTGNEALTRVWSREHYLMYEHDDGLYARVGRFMPVFGLRLAEHPSYVRRFGGTPLFADTYGAHVAYVTSGYEAHLSGFIEDPLLDPVVHGNGGAAYGEVRVTEELAVGAEGMIRRGDDSTRYHAGVTAKYYIPGANLLLQGEVQYTPQVIDVTPTNPSEGNPRGIVGVLMASLMLPKGLMVDVALNHYDPNYQVKDLDRDAIDVNVHWFSTSHIELVLNTRYELLQWGLGGRSGGYALMQVHYRL